MAVPAPSALEPHVLDFLAYLEFERGLSRNTLEAYRSDLLQYGAYLREHGIDPLKVNHTQLSDFLSGLAEGDPDADRPPAGGPPRPPPPPGRPPPRCSARSPACGPSTATSGARTSSTPTRPRTS